MKLIKHNTLFILFTAIAGFVIHKAVSYCFIPKEFETNFVYPTLLLYALFAGFSIVIVWLLDRVKKMAPNSVGYAFLAFTTLKMAIAYAFLRPILHTHLPKTPTEKMNFFVVFMYFLVIETYLTIRILNNKQ